MGNTPVAFQEGAAGGKTIIGPNPALAKLTELLGDEAIAEIITTEQEHSAKSPLSEVLEYLVFQAVAFANSITGNTSAIEDMLASAMRGGLDMDGEQDDE